jgi:predicted dehydrogenase
MSDNLNVLVVGAGLIAREYVKVLLAQNIIPIVVSRGQEKANQLKEQFPNVVVKTGGLQDFLKRNECPNYSIVATARVDLASSTIALINSGCKQILVEKPLTYSITEAKEIELLAAEKECCVCVAFNRRAYQSVLKAKELIEEDGGVSSFYFNSTEALFTIIPHNHDEIDMKYLGIGNSCHPIDTAFYLGGKPKWIECKQYGNAFSLHPTGSIFLGIGETESGVPFSYNSDWGAPGKWSVEIMTKKRKLIFSPMEKLQQQELNSFLVKELPLDYQLDLDFKPGFYCQVEAFLKNKGLAKIEELIEEMAVLNKIFNY